MAILPIHSALQNPDIAGNFQQGLKFGTAQRLQRQAEQEQQQLRELAPAIQSGDPAAFGQAAVISPEYASAQQSVGDGGIRRLKGAITFIEQAQKTGNPRAVEAAYQQVRPYLARFGQEPPATFAEAEPKFMEAKARIAMLDSPQGQQRNLAVTPGTAIVNPETGEVIYERPFAPAKPVWDSARAMFISPPGAAGPAAGPTKPDMESDIALANEMVAAGVNPEVVDRLLRARGERAQQMMGAQPAGPQAIPVPGVAPKPDISALDQERLNIDRERLRLQQQEQERKANAPSPATQKANAAQATKLPQVNNVERGLERIDAAMKALQGGLVNTGPIDQYVVRGLPTGQELEAAVGGIQNSLLALTRVPGVGSQSDLEAKIAALQYPSLDKDPEVNRRTLENLRQFVNDLKQQIQAVPAQTAEPAQRAVNPTTGEVLVLRNGQWVPE